MKNKELNHMINNQYKNQIPQKSNYCTQRNDDSLQNDYSKWLYAMGKSSFAGKGISFADIDSVCWNYDNRRMMFIETKEHMAELKINQKLMFEQIYMALTASMGDKFKGFHFLQFSKSSPTGNTFIQSFNGKEWVNDNTFYSSSVQVEQWFLDKMVN